MENQQSAYAKTKAQISFAVTAKLISAFVFATWIAQFIYFLKSKFPVSSRLLCLYSPVCVGPVWKPHCWFSHEAAHFQIVGVWSQLIMLDFILSVIHPSQGHMSHVVRKPDFAGAKTKAQISCAVTAKQISAFVFATWIVQFLLYLFPKFQAYMLLLCLYSSVCVRPDRKS